MCVPPAAQCLWVHGRWRREGRNDNPKKVTRQLMFSHLVWLVAEIPSVVEQEQGDVTPPYSSPGSPAPHTPRASPGQTRTIWGMCNTYPLLPHPPPHTLTALDSLVVRSTASPCSVPPEGVTLVSTALVVPSSTLVLHRTLPSRGSCVHKRLSH